MNPAPSLGTLGIIGAGNMGMGMVQRWRSLGGGVHVCDLDRMRQQQARELGCSVHDTPHGLAQTLTDDALLVVCVVDGKQSHEVLFGPNGAAAALAPQTTVMLCPTIAPQDTEAMANALAMAKLCCIDAPMSGGPVRAAQGQMSLMVACDDAIWARNQCKLEALANPVFRVSSRPGDGARTKLVNNLLAAINLVGAAEALAMAQRLGLNPQTTWDVIEQSSGQSWIGSDRMRRALAQDFAPRAHMSLLAKDSRLAIEAARDCGFQGPLGPAAAAQFAEAMGRWAQVDDAAMLEHLRAAAGVDSRANGGT